MEKFEIGNLYTINGESMKCVPAKEHGGCDGCSLFDDKTLNRSCVDDVQEQCIRNHNMMFKTEPKIPKIIKIDSGTFQEVFDDVSCAFCACNWNATGTCDEINRVHDCEENNCMFKKIEEEETLMIPKTEELKYTVREVLTAFDEGMFWDNDDFDILIEKVSKKLKLESDPDYIEYLRLKEKFESTK